MLYRSKPKLLESFIFLTCMAASIMANAQLKTPVAPGASSTCPALLNHRMKKLQDETSFDLCQYAGKVVLVVNTASYCAFTQQYAPLEKLYQAYQAKGLIVLGFPSNDFSQEPGSAKQIADFCVNTYGVAFPMTTKTSVSGTHAHPFYKALALATGGEAPAWNFHKYLIARDGKTVRSFGSITSPDSGRIVKQIETLLAQKS